MTDQLPTPLFDDDLSTVYLGEALSILQHLPDQSVDVVLTDSPYSSGGMTRGDRAHGSTRKKYQNPETRKRYPEFTGDNRDQRAFLRWCMIWIDELRRVTKPGAIVGCFADWRQLPTMSDGLQAGGLVWRGIVPWVKKGPRPQMGRFAAAAEYLVWGTNGPRPLAGPCLPGSFSFRTPPRKRHLTEKPVELMVELCAIAFESEAVILDPFMGSASTLVAARSLGIRSIGIEIDPVIAAIGVERLEEPGQRPDYQRGDDDGCFEAALAAVRRWGGVLEHPAYSDAWPPAFGLPEPPRGGGWQFGLCGGAAAHVEQGRYGHVAKKATWLYAFGCDLPSLRWGSIPDRSSQAIVSWCGNRTDRFDTRPRVGKAAAARTPEAFREVLIEMARSARRAAA